MQPLTCPQLAGRHKRATCPLSEESARVFNACVREAIAQYVQRFSNNDEAQRQSALIAEHSGKPNWSEQLPDWTDWTA